MYGFMTKLIASGKLKFSEGKISLLNEPMAMISMNSIKEMTDYAMSSGTEEDIAELYFHGWTYGYSFCYHMAQAFDLKRFEERYKVTMDTAAMCGFGDYQTMSFKKGHYSYFKVLENPFALLYYQQRKGKKGEKIYVDHFLRGMNGGGGTTVHERMVDCVELECAANNGKYCIHKNVTEEEMNKLDQDLAKSQVNLKLLRPRQFKLIKSMGHDPKKYTAKREIL
jgi:hypothetical protein